MTLVGMTAGAFADVVDHWAQKNIEEIAQMGIVEGYPDGNFYPEQTVTYAEFLQMLYELDGGYLNAAIVCWSQEQDGSYVVDDRHTEMDGIDSSDWYYENVAWGNNRLLMGGFPEGTFKPNEAIPRGDMAVIISNYLRSVNWYHWAHTGRNFQYADAGEFPEYAFSAIDAVSKGYMVMEGYARVLPDGYSELGYGSGGPSYLFRPQNSLTRAEASTIIARIARQSQDEYAAYPTYLELTQEDVNTAKVVLEKHVKSWEDKDADTYLSTVTDGEERTYIQYINGAYKDDEIKIKRIWYDSQDPERIRKREGADNLSRIVFTVDFDVINPAKDQQDAQKMKIELVRENEDAQWLVYDTHVVHLK